MTVYIGFFADILKHMSYHIRLNLYMVIGQQL